MFGRITKTQGILTEFGKVLKTLPSLFRNWILCDDLGWKEIFASEITYLNCFPDTSAWENPIFCVPGYPAWIKNVKEEKDSSISPEATFTIPLVLSQNPTHLHFPWSVLTSKWMETSFLFQSTSCIITPKLHTGIVPIMLSVGSQKAAIKKIQIQTTEPIWRVICAHGRISHHLKCVAPTYEYVQWQAGGLALSLFSCCWFLPDVLQLICGLDLIILLGKKIEIVKDPGQQFSKIFCLPQLSQPIWTELVSILVLIKNLSFKSLLWGG